MPEIRCKNITCVSNDMCYTEGAVIGNCTVETETCFKAVVEIDENGNCETYEHYSLYPD